MKNRPFRDGEHSLAAKGQKSNGAQSMGGRDTGGRVDGLTGGWAGRLGMWDKSIRYP